MLKQKYFLADIFILSAEKQPIKLSWRKIVCLLHECSITKGARELSPEYLEEIKHYHLNRAERFFMSHNNKQKKEGVYGFEKIMFHLILFPVPNKENIVNWFVKRANQIKQDA